MWYVCVCIILLTKSVLELTHIVGYIFPKEKISKEKKVWVKKAKL
jgi:hypothetical protein